jgi:hypothetical protein
LYRSGEIYLHKNLAKAGGVSQQTHIGYLQVCLPHRAFYSRGKVSFWVGESGELYLVDGNVWSR